MKKRLIRDNSLPFDGLFWSMKLPGVASQLEQILKATLVQRRVFGDAIVSGLGRDVHDMRERQMRNW